MKMLLVLLAVGLAAADRLENTYLPPVGADQAGGQNLALPSQDFQLPRTHTEAVVRAPSNSYLPPVNNVVVEAKLQQPPKPLGNIGILRQQGLQSTLGSGAPAPLLPQPQQAPKYTSAFSAQLPTPTAQQSNLPVTQLTTYSQESSLPQQSSSFGSSQSSFPQQFSSFGSQSSLPKATPFQQSSLPQLSSSFGSSQSSLPKATPFQFSSQSTLPKATPFTPQQQSSFTTQQTASPQVTPFAAELQPTAFSGPSSSFNVKQGQQQSTLGPRQGDLFGSAAPSGQNVAILRSASVNNGDGSYTYSYATENGIEAQEQGELRQGGLNGESASLVQGGFAFTAPDSNARYTLTYTADENGFHPYGDHLPTPPPIPEAILRSIEINAREEQQGYKQSGQNQQGYQQSGQNQQGYKQSGQNQQGYQQSEPIQQAYQKSSLNQGYQQPAIPALPQVVQRQGYQQSAPSQQQGYQQPQNYQGYQQSRLTQQGYPQQSSGLNQGFQHSGLNQGYQHSGLNQGFQQKQTFPRLSQEQRYQPSGFQQLGQRQQETATSAPYDSSRDGYRY